LDFGEILGGKIIIIKFGEEKEGGGNYYY